MALTDLLGVGGEKIPSFTFSNVGDKVLGRLDGDLGEYHVREFKKGGVGEKLYFQNKKKTKESELQAGLPYNPIMGVVFTLILKDGTKTSVWADREKLKAVRKAVQEFHKEHGRIPGEGDMASVQFTAEEEGAGTFPKKVFAAQFKAKKSE